MQRIVIALAAFIAFGGGFFAAPADAEGIPTCTAAEGPVVWYVSSSRDYFVRGSKQYGKGDGEYLCLSDARSAQYYSTYRSHRKGARKKPGKKGGSRSPASIVDSVYDTVTRKVRAERPGYGRYTYVLLTSPNETQRNNALLKSIMETTPSADSVTTEPEYLNVFELPVTAKYDRASVKAGGSAYALANYDFGFAHDLLLRACASPQRPVVCRGPLTGPFLLTYGRPLESVTVANPPYLIIDLHYLNPRGFSHVVAMMKEQVKQSDVADGRLVENWSVHLLSTALDTADWLPGILSSAKQLKASLVEGSGTH